MSVSISNSGYPDATPPPGRRYLVINELTPDEAKAFNGEIGAFAEDRGIKDRPTRFAKTLAEWRQELGPEPHLPDMCRDGKPFRVPLERYAGRDPDATFLVIGWRVPNPAMHRALPPGDVIFERGIRPVG